MPCPPAAVGDPRRPSRGELLRPGPGRLSRAEEHREYAARPERLRERLAAVPAAESVVIDEIQKVPELLDVVHALIEGRRPSPRFILTGSSARKLRRGGVNLTLN